MNTASGHAEVLSKVMAWSYPSNVKNRGSSCVEVILRYCLGLSQVMLMSCPGLALILPRSRQDFVEVMPRSGSTKFKVRKNIPEDPIWFNRINRDHRMWIAVFIFSRMKENFRTKKKFTEQFLILKYQRCSG
uniref:Uncharacterized protein n=1 Tax=Caenorhabditis japonica TaxID=281687 RepID=A0A8R1IT14_CAEJA